MKVSLPYNYQPRDYQRPFLEAMSSGVKRAVCVWHRRAGKDKTFLNMTINQMAQRVGTYYYYFPTLSMGRRILWDGIDKDGFKTLDHFPKQFVKNINQQEMKIKTLNGSVFQIIGTDRLDVVGTNPVGCVFSEFSLQNPKGWDYVRPILAENGGWAAFNFTPRGYNHAKDLFDMSNDNPEWFRSLLTVNDTGAISAEAIEDERLSGMSEDMILQEFYCSFDLGIEGSYYAKFINKARDEGRICEFAADTNNLVHTAWDIGIGDSTAIWFYQVSGMEIHVIDYYENNGEGIAHYAKVLDNKRNDLGYIYGRHYAPHDIANKSFSTGETRLQTAKQMGINFNVLDRSPVDDGIEKVREILPRCWFNINHCETGIKSLESYRKEYDDKKQVYKLRPRHDWASHGADAFRYMARSIADTTMNTVTHKKLNELRHKYSRVA